MIDEHYTVCRPQYSRYALSKSLLRGTTVASQEGATKEGHMGGKWIKGLLEDIYVAPWPLKMMLAADVICKIFRKFRHSPPSVCVVLLCGRSRSRSRRRRLSREIPLLCLCSRTEVFPDCVFPYRVSEAWILASYALRVTYFPVLGPESRVSEGRLPQKASRY